MSLKLNERYPGRFNNPSVGYPGGSFKNRTTPTAKDGSYLEKDWANDKEGFFQSLLSAAGITANGAVDAVGASQFFDALQALKQTQAGTAFTTAGTAAAQTLTPTPAISAYAAPLRFRVKFSQASTGSGTINISGIGARNLKQYDYAGAKVAAVYAVGQLADIEYDGTDFVLLDQLPASIGNFVGIQGAYKNLLITTTGLSALAVITADEIVVESSTNTYQTLRSVNVSPSLSVSGVNGLDTGTVAAGTWYSLWVIWNGSTKAGLLSLSGTAPALPSGYTHAARVGWVRTDATANKYPLNFTQTGRRAQYRVGTGTNVAALPVIAQAASAIPLWTAIGTGGVVPPTASAIDVGCLSQSASSQLAWCYVVPNNNYSTTVSATAPVAIGSGSYNTSLTATRTLMTLESANIYWGTLTSSGGSMGVYCAGWEDNL